MNCDHVKYFEVLLKWVKQLFLITLAVVPSEFEFIHVSTSDFALTSSFSVDCYTNT